MHAQICEFPSKSLYSSKLLSDASVASHLLRDLPETKAESEDEEKEVLCTPLVFFDTAGCEYFERLEGDGDEGGRCNENEATVVKGWVDQLVCFILFTPVDWNLIGTSSYRSALAYRPHRLL
jgi:DNA polymerase alpha-associated DNA helicase A